MTLAKHWWECMTTILVLAGLGGFALLFDGRPLTISAVEEPSAFSMAKTRAHLEAITVSPHPRSSPELAKVRTYLLEQITALGLEPLIQDDARPNQPDAPVSLVNVMTRIKGRESNHTLIFVSHYDSAAVSYGAGDDGAAVACMLETMRAIKAGPPLKNDMIFLFTDGEEDGLLGADLFAKSHPWAKEVDLAFNFEGRGSSGPVIMFETSDNSRWLVDEFRKCTPYGVATSVSDEIYKMMPNNTDFTVFKSIPGVQGLNFAFIGGPHTYHDPLDRNENLNQRTLNHMGLQMLAVARHFGNLEPQTSTVTDIYFRTPLLGLDRYSQTLVLPLLIALGLGVLATIWRSLKTRGEGPLKLILGAVAALTLFASCIAAAFLTWKLFKGVVRPAFPGATGHPHHAEVYFYGFLFLSFGLVISGMQSLKRWLAPENIALGGLLIWMVLAVGSSLYMPGASYLYVLPLAGACLGHLVGPMLASQRGRGLFIALCDLPALWVFLPFAALFHLALGYPVPALLSGLHGGLLALLLLPRVYERPQCVRALGVGAILTGLGVFLVLAILA